jgi:hypothetical protein
MTDHDTRRQAGADLQSVLGMLADLQDAALSAPDAGGWRHTADGATHVNQRAVDDCARMRGTS